MPIAFTYAQHGRELRLDDTQPFVGDPFVAVAESVAHRLEFAATVGTDAVLAPKAQTVECRPAAGAAIKPGVQRDPIAHRVRGHATAEKRANASVRRASRSGCGGSG